jgi:ABC-type proline/glycine betaine transport system ATPase subunit
LENIKVALKNKTIIIVSHRLSTVLKADQIVVMEDGEMIECGSHEELTFVRGAYYQLVKNTIASAQIPKDLQHNVRKVEDLLTSASGSKLGQKFTKGLGWIFENEKLDQLVKNLAQVQARNAAIMGLDKTDSSRELNAKLSGSENISPEALKEIMKQVKAESTAAEMFNEGLKKFVDNRGDINGKIQAQKFESAWKENYDPRIFQMRNITNSNLSKTEKQNRINEIIGKMTPEELNKIKEKSQNLHDLHIGNFQ